MVITGSFSETVSLHFRLFLFPVIFVLVILSLNMLLLNVKLLGSSVQVTYYDTSCHSTKQIGLIRLITPTTMMERRAMFLH
jgi:hypothetical protein